MSCGAPMRRIAMVLTKLLRKAVRPSNRMSIAVCQFKYVPLVSFRLQITSSEITADGRR
jgi:hypothetical protein